MRARAKAAKAARRVARAVLILIEDDRYVRARKLHRPCVNDVTDEDDLLAFAGEGIEGASGRVTGLRLGHNSRDDFGLPLEGLHLARVRIGLERLGGFRPIALVVIVQTGVPRIKKKSRSALPT